MSTYSHQQLTAFANDVEDLKSLVPFETTSHTLTITWDGEANRTLCFNVKEISKQYPKLIFLLDTSIEVYVWQRDLYMNGDTVTLFRVEEAELMEMTNAEANTKDESHNQFSDRHTYSELKALLKEKLETPISKEKVVLTDDMDFINLD